MRISEIFLLENLSINVPYHRVILRKYMNIRGREDLLIHGQKILMDYRILLME
jgi:hypothetical protein